LLAAFNPYDRKGNRMVLLLIPILLLIAFVVDCLLAFFAMLIAPETGLAFLEGLDFWNWFWIVVLAQLLTWTSTASASRS
jgi:hypothetical protein